MANFEAFCRTKKLISNLFFLKSDHLQSLNCFPRCFDLINLGESPRNWTLAQNAVLQSMANLPSSTFTAHPIFYTKPIICRDVK